MSSDRNARTGGGTHGGSEDHGDDESGRRNPSTGQPRRGTRAGPRRGRTGDGIEGAPIPKELEAALISLYRDYARHHAQWSEANMGRPPVFIVVCSNTSVSKLLFDWIAGFERELPDGSKVVVPGHLDLFSNERDGGWRDRPNSLLIDSAELDRGEPLAPAFKKAAAAEITEFKHEYVARFPGRSAS